jgi:hypothetical protein
VPKLNFPSEELALGTLPTTMVENEGLMTNKIQEQVVAARAPRIPTPRNINPYLNQTPKEILERMYEVPPGFTITPATAELAIQFVPPQFDQPQFIKAISSFRYIRWKSVDFMLQTLVSPFTYGWFGLTGVPWSTDGTYNQRDGILSTDFGNLSHDDAMICDVSSGNQFELSIPWAFTSEWMDTMKLSYSAGAFDPYAAFKRMCSMKLFYIFQAINSLNSTVPAQVNGIVFCRFSGVEVAGPRQTTEISPPSLRFQSGLKHYDEPENAIFRFQSQVGSIGPTIGVLATGAMGILGGGIHNYMNRQVGNAVGDVVSGVSEAAGEVMAPFLSENVEEPGEPLTQDGVEDGESQSTNVVPSVFGSMGYSKSVNVLGCGSMGLSGKGHRNSIKRILMKPSFLNFFSIPYNLSTPVQFELDPFGVGQVASTADLTLQRSCSRIRFFGNFFRMWRGTVKYSLVFISSPLVTWKFKILITYGPTTPVLGDVISQVITVKGSTVYDFAVPYLYVNPWRVCSIDTIFTGTNSVVEMSPAMYISLAAAPVSSGDVHPNMQVLMYQAAGNDFQFACPKDPMPYAPGDAPEFQFQMKVSTLCKNDLIAQGSGKSPNYYADNILSCESLAKRWSTRFVEEYDGPDPAYQSSFGANNFVYSCLDAMSTLFLYWHGQYKMKLQFTTDPDNPPPSSFLALNMVMLPYTINSPVVSPSADGVPRPLRFNDGSHVISADLTQVLEVTVPFLSSTEWVPVWRLTQTGDERYSNFNVGAMQTLFTPRLYTVGSSTYQFPLEWMAIAAGSDFVFSYDLPPPSSATRWYDTFPPDLEAQSKNNEPEVPAAPKSGKKKIDPLQTGTDHISELLASCVKTPKGSKRQTPKGAQRRSTFEKH